MHISKSFAVTPLLLFAVAIGAWQYARSRTQQVFGEITSHVVTDMKLIALTFDDGPSPSAVEEIIRILRARDARATFFVTGSELQRHPQAAQALVSAGHELGNHSYSHSRMLFTDTREIASEIEATDALIRAAGQTGPIHFRPPYGIKGFALPRFLEESGRRTIMWNIEPDSDRHVAESSESITEHVLANAEPGAIILLHPMYASRRTSLDSVNGIVVGLQDQGYRLVTVSELLAAADAPHTTPTHATKD